MFLLFWFLFELYQNHIRMGIRYQQHVFPMRHKNQNLNHTHISNVLHKPFQYSFHNVLILDSLPNYVYVYVQVVALAGWHFLLYFLLKNLKHYCFQNYLYFLQMVVKAFVQAVRHYSTHSLVILCCICIIRICHIIVRYRRLYFRYRSLLSFQTFSPLLAILVPSFQSTTSTSFFIIQHL